MVSTYALQLSGAGLFVIRYLLTCMMQKRKCDGFNINKKTYTVNSITTQHNTVNSIYTISTVRNVPQRS